MDDDALYEWMERRFTPPDAGRRLQLCAEHEAAHAVVADALGLDVATVRVSATGDGATVYEHGTREQTAVVAVAPSVWVDLRWEQFPEGDWAGCAGDRQRLAEYDAVSRQEARRCARAILTDRADDVVALAKRLANANLVNRDTVDFQKWKAARNRRKG